MENKYIDINEDDKDFWLAIDNIKEINNKYFEETGQKKKYMTITYGCQMNEHDSEKMAWILELMGYVPADREEDADFLVYNTCAIRENAELKVYGKIGSLKTVKENKKDLIVALCGCMMQIDDIRETIEEKFRHVDLIFGTHNIHRLPMLLDQRYETGKMAIDVVEDSMDLVEGLSNIRESQHKAYVNIMYGCNNFCTYCVVPYTRGRENSRLPEDIILEVKNLVEKGYKEIMLLGQNVNSYGKTLDFKYDFVDLLRDINEIPGLERIRFMTSHPKDISLDLIKAYGQLDKLSNHLHLPVQSGSNEILRKMNRNYTREKYLNDIKKIKEVSPDISLSTDIIVGFPGETEEDFQATLDLVREVEYDFIYNFIYSIRPGTKAGLMEDQIAYEIKHDRFERLSNLINEISLNKNKSLVGKEVKVLAEEISKTDATKLSGRTDDFKIVHFPGEENLIGEIVNIRITKGGTFSLEGELV